MAEDGARKIFPPRSPPPMPLSKTSLARLAGAIARGVTGPVVWLGGGLAALAYPPLCLGCDGRLPDARDALCAPCVRGLPRADADAARRMLAGAPVADVAVLWAFDPGGTVRRVQHALKYRGRPSLGVGLGEALAAAVRETGIEADAVVPVPLSRVRELERGYNQAEALAHGLGRALGVPVAPLLVRTRATLTQASLPAAERRRNVDGAFALAPGVTVPRRVLLVDDVLTTGATLTAAARPLAEAGATVHVAALGLAGA